LKLIIVSPSAEADLLEIGEFIKDDNPDRAVSFTLEIFARFEIVAERPKSFPARNEIMAGLRLCLHGKYLILFVENKDHVRIVRVVHGSRHLNRLTLDSPT
jgi:toxin ParE1/3/4